jgi:hypothetical protein
MRARSLGLPGANVKRDVSGSGELIGGFEPAGAASPLEGHRADYCVSPPMITRARKPCEEPDSVPGRLCEAVIASEMSPGYRSQVRSWVPDRERTRSRESCRRRLLTVRRIESFLNLQRERLDRLRWGPGPNADRRPSSGSRPSTTLAAAPNPRLPDADPVRGPFTLS